VQTSSVFKNKKSLASHRDGGAGVSTWVKVYPDKDLRTVPIATICAATCMKRPTATLVTKKSFKNVFSANYLFQAKEVSCSIPKSVTNVSKNTWPEKKRKVKKK